MLRLCKLFAMALLLPVVTALAGCGGGSRKVLYSVGTGTPAVILFRVENSGALSATNDIIGTGSNPGAIVVTPNKKYAYVADSAGATVAGGVSQYTVSGSSGVKST